MMKWKKNSSVAAQKILASLIENKGQILKNKNLMAMNLRSGAGENMTEFLSYFSTML